MATEYYYMYSANWQQQQTCTYMLYHLIIYKLGISKNNSLIINKTKQNRPSQG